MTTDHETTEAELIEKLLEQVEGGVSWYDGNGHLQTFEDFGDEARDRVTFFVRSRKGKPFEEADLFAYLKYMQIADLSAAHIPIRAVRRCGPIYIDLATRLSRCKTNLDGSADDEIITRVGAARSEVVNAMLATGGVSKDAAVAKATCEIFQILNDKFGSHTGFKHYWQACSRFPVDDSTDGSETKRDQDSQNFLQEIIQTLDSLELGMSSGPWKADVMDNVGKNWLIATLGTDDKNVDHIVTTDGVLASEAVSNPAADAQFLALVRTHWREISAAAKECVGESKR